MKKQIFVIHGGTSAFADYQEFITYLKNKSVDFEKSKNSEDWKTNLPKVLGEGYEVVSPRMPNSQNARYLEWKIWFEKFVPFMQEEIILIGHSLGAIFLAKYLSEENFPKKIRGTFLVAPPFDEGGSGEWARKMAEFALPSSLEKFQKQGGEIFLYHSKDDHIVNFSESAKYQSELPSAHFKGFEDRQHFNVMEFPEIVADIKRLTI